MRVEEFDFDLPLELIAQKPLASRDASRLLVVKRGSGECVDGKFSDLPLYLRPSDVLVINDSRVLPARLWGQNPQKSGLVEILLLRPHGEGKWEVLVRPGKKARVGAEIVFSPRLSCTVLDTTPNGTRLVQFHFEGDFQGILEELGKPLCLLIFMRNWMTLSATRRFTPSIPVRWQLPLRGSILLRSCWMP